METEIATGTAADLSFELSEVIDAPEVQQYKFSFEPKVARPSAVDQKYGYLWFGGEHRLNVSRPKR